MAESLNIDAAAETENGGPESACAIPGDASECSPEAPCVISGGFAEWKQVFGIKDRDLRDYPALTLAYIGDSVYELAVRTVLVRKSRSAVGEIIILAAAVFLSELIHLLREIIRAELLHKLGKVAALHQIIHLILNIFKIFIRNAHFAD